MTAGRSNITWGAWNCRLTLYKSIPTTTRASSMAESEKGGTLAIERLPSNNEHLVDAYEPRTEEARTLDKRINLKLDFCVVLVLAIDFILCGIDKTNIGYVATTSEQCLSLVKFHGMI